jgi:leucyl-tRNA synthetase
LYDLGLVSTKEPFQRLVNQGMITSFAYQRKNKTLVPVDEVEQKDDGNWYEKATGEKLEQVVAKMSKSLKNVVNPDDEIRSYGADSVRMYEMFMGPLTMSKPWATQGIVGIHRFLEKVWALSEKPLADIKINGKLEDKKLVSLRKTFTQTVKKVGDDTSSLNFNTAISQMMIFVNELSKFDAIPTAIWTDFVKILSPYAPHLGEELWEKLGNKKSIAYEAWPTYNEEFLKDDTKTIIVSINGKPRDKFEAAPGTDKETLEKMAISCEGVQKYIDGQQIVKVIAVPDKIVNIVVK